ncbi:TPA: hypothetical protein KQG29_001457 [Clostridioides difficile]|uniref:hypothetical protein n=1 Tax=Clostridioides sp. ZZV15-6597 TaxID=2811500 RepID=UPI001C19C4A4|nr:hypothetical protein [Clostridioides sp. ZZV15-6597]HBF1820671.1 hypothetical protein [Clostridioides difficile]HBG5344093.1 hypothetical protein [Clostridioides difficile]
MINYSRINYIVGRAKTFYDSNKSIDDSISKAEGEYEDILNGKIDFLLKMNEIDFVEWVNFQIQ